MIALRRKREVYVYADWQNIHYPKLMGVLSAELLRGKEVFSFAYHDSWLTSKHAQMLDPDLQLYSGKQFLNDSSKVNFGLFLDSSPDRWGRVLMRRREAAIARLEKRNEASLFETDYLLGVFDSHRMGGLRFKTNIDGPFLSDNNEMASPPWTSIAELEQISMRLEEDDIASDPEYLKWLNLLVTPGSSLGGARPKASILVKDNTLWIAKFPSKNDDTNVGGWEMVTQKLALQAGVNMAAAKAQKFSSKHHTYLSQRFDRAKNGERIHFASAMTLLGYTDGHDYTDGVSYLELAEFISNHSVEVQEDLAQLWRRIVFSICVCNVDDHLRNHGFMLTSKGWRLSPAYDINPVEFGTGLKLNISENDNALDLELALEVISYFRLTKNQAFAIIQEVKNAVSTWQTIAQQLGIAKQEMDQKAHAFRNASRGNT